MKDINKDIENLEEIINLINKELDKKDKNVSAILDLKDLLSLRNLIKAYKELEEDNKQLKTRRIIGSIYDVKIEDLKDVLSPYYIPKSVIKEKIDKKQKQLELLKKELQGRQTNFVNKNIITGQIQVLQELLEKRK